MAARVLIVFLAVAVFMTAAAEEPRCLACHDAHYVAEGACTVCHRGDPRTSRADIAHRDRIGARFAGFLLPDDELTAAGLEWIEGLACRRCHVVAGTGNALAAGLDDLFFEASPAGIEVALREPLPAMPAFGLTSQQRTAVVRALLRTSRQSPRQPVEVPRIVHFEGGRSTGQNPFQMHCGGCHRALTNRHGGLGRGSTGPNLSGLFTDHYPAPEEGLRWDGERLKRWVDNPRSLVPTATMAPLRLLDRELEDLVGIFAAGSP